MRRQINWLVLAVTGLVVVAFVVPLGLLVRRQAVERAQIAAEQRAQSAAAALAVAVSAGDGVLTPVVAESALVTDVVIHLPDGRVVGDMAADMEVVAAARSGRPTGATSESGNWTVALPVATPQGIVAVAAVTTSEEMNAGVGRAVGLLAGLAVVLVAASVLLADRLGRSVVVPVSQVATVADHLAGGDLATRAPVDGPPEVRRVAAALNGLADRLSDIIEGERESLADLSHRLRTPLTALRLQAERATDPDEREALVKQIERTQDAVDRLIREVRSRGRGSAQPSDCDATAVVGERLEFWKILADAQERDLDVHLPDAGLPVAVAASELAAGVDALVGNVFTHTEKGTAFSVRLGREAGVPVLEVADSGPGFDTTAVERGRSGGGSTGLGLDIARGLAESLGGKLEMDEGPDGGALVRLRLGR